MCTYPAGTHTSWLFVPSTSLFHPFGADVFCQLVGPYASSRRLELSDRILIGRTGFSVNRFDWGIWEDRGSRRTMEDKSVVIQVNEVPFVF